MHAEYPPHTHTQNTVSPLISFMSTLSKVLCKWHVDLLTLAAKPTAGTTRTPLIELFKHTLLMGEHVGGGCGSRDLGAIDPVSKPQGWGAGSSPCLHPRHTADIKSHWHQHIKLWLCVYLHCKWMCVSKNDSVTAYRVPGLLSQARPKMACFKFSKLYYCSLLGWMCQSKVTHGTLTASCTCTIKSTKTVT